MRRQPLAGAPQRAAVIFAAAVLAAVAAACTAAPGGFPALIYPPPVSFPAWGKATGCPSLDGAEPPGTPSEAPFRSTVDNFGRDLAADLHAADRAFWPDIVTQRTEPGAAGQPRLRHAVIGAGADKAPYAALIAKNCGGQTLNRSWWIQSCPTAAAASCARSPGLVVHWFFINRRGRWLVWLTFP